jgi:hypothetical protein
VCAVPGLGDVRWYGRRVGGGLRVVRIHKPSYTDGPRRGRGVVADRGCPKYKLWALT